MFPKFLSAFFCPMLLDVIAGAETLKITEVVVEGIVVPVVDVPPVGDVSVSVEPNFFVKTLEAVLALRTVRCEVNPVRTVLRVRVTSVDVPFIGDLFHPNIISP